MRRLIRQLSEPKLKQHPSHGQRGRKAELGEPLDGATRRALLVLLRLCRRGHVQRERGQMRKKERGRAVKAGDSSMSTTGPGTQEDVLDRRQSSSQTCILCW